MVFQDHEVPKACLDPPEEQLQFGIRGFLEEQHTVHLSRLMKLYDFLGVMRYNRQTEIIEL